MKDSGMVAVRVGLGPRAYDIEIGEGLFAALPRHLAELGGRKTLSIVTDDTVWPLHGAALTGALEAGGYDPQPIILPAGEKTKNFNQLSDLCETLLEQGVERGDLILAFGGGVIGDIAGFAAAILRRGCRFIQIPTTLLAQVDSSVGGKTAVNAKAGKNLIGAFHQPSLVLADIGVLETLPRRELLAGYAEVVKYGALGDRAFFAWLEENGTALLDGDRALRREAVRQCVTAKARIVEADEREGGIRALLNLGHTFGHALEAATGFSSRLLHGEGVAIGIVLAFEFSHRLGLCPQEDAPRLATHFREVGLPVGMADIPDFTASVEELVRLMLQDKKVQDGKLTFILAREIGDSFVANDIPADKLHAFLENKLA